MQLKESFTKRVRKSLRENMFRSIRQEMMNDLNSEEKEKRYWENMERLC